MFYEGLEGAHCGTVLGPDPAELPIRGNVRVSEGLRIAWTRLIVQTLLRAWTPAVRCIAAFERQSIRLDGLIGEDDSKPAEYSGSIVPCGFASCYRPAARSFSEFVLVTLKKPFGDKARKPALRSPFT